MTRRHLITALLALLAAPSRLLPEWPFHHEGACLQLGGGYGGTTYGACAYGGMCACLPSGVHRFEGQIFSDGFESGDASRWT